MMTKFNYGLASLSLLTILSLFLTPLAISQASSNTSDLPSDLILFNRRHSRGQWPYSIVALDVATGEERYLTTDGFCCATSWSPDGNHILGFVSNENVWAGRELFVMDAYGRNRHILNDKNLVSANDGHWSPDSTRIYLWGRDMQAEQRRLAIYVVPANGGSIRRLTELRSPSSGGGLAISPDGAQIAFTENRGLYIMSSEGGEPRELGASLQFGSTISWSPDGSQIVAFVVTSNGAFELHSVAADGSGSRLLVAGMGSFREESWSPDSSELLFIAEPNRPNYTVLGIMNVQTGTIRRYDMGQGIFEPLIAIYGAVWSADGRQIVISAVYRENNPYNTQYSLYLLDHDVSQIQRLTQAGVADKVVQWRPQR